MTRVDTVRRELATLGRKAERARARLEDLNRERNERIVELAAAGLSLREIAELARVTNPRVDAILKAATR